MNITFSITEIIELSMLAVVCVSCGGCWIYLKVTGKIK